MRRPSSISISPSYWDDDDDEFTTTDATKECDEADNEASTANSYGSIGCGRNDILCGKDKTYSKHPGNKIFRRAVEAFRDLYAAARCKQDKMAITRAVVRRLQDECGARFVRFHEGKWEEITDVMARDKVSHALRFSLREGGTTGAGTAVGAGGKRSSAPQAALGQRRSTLLLPRRTYSLQLGEGGDEFSHAATLRLASKLHSSSRRDGTAFTAPPSSDGHSVDMDDEDNEAVAADAMRRCQLFIFQNLRLEDPLENGLGLNLLSVPLVSSGGPCPHSSSTAATAAV